MNIVVHDQQNLLESQFPTTSNDRTFYTNDHFIHTGRLGIIAPEAVSFFNYLRKFNLYKSCTKMIQTLLKIRHIRSYLIGKYDNGNTYSDGLPDFALNRTISDITEKA